MRCCWIKMYASQNGIVFENVSNIKLFNRSLSSFGKYIFKNFSLKFRSIHLVWFVCAKHFRLQNKCDFLLLWFIFVLVVMSYTALKWWNFSYIFFFFPNSSHFRKKDKSWNNLRFPFFVKSFASLDYSSMVFRMENLIV